MGEAEKNTFETIESIGMTEQLRVAFNFFKEPYTQMESDYQKEDKDPDGQRLKINADVLSHVPALIMAIGICNTLMDDEKSLRSEFRYPSGRVKTVSNHSQADIDQARDFVREALPSANDAFIAEHRMLAHIGQVRGAYKVLEQALRLSGHADRRLPQRLNESLEIHREVESRSDQVYEVISASFTSRPVCTLLEG